MMVECIAVGVPGARGGQPNVGVDGVLRDVIVGDGRSNPAERAVTLDVLIGPRPERSGSYKAQMQEPWLSYRSLLEAANHGTRL